MIVVYALIAVVLIVVVILAVNGVLRRRVTARHDSLEDAMSDEKEPIPSSHLIPDNETAAGDTPEAHDEINPRDIPQDNPARHEAEERVGGGGETAGDRGGDSRAE
jgi:hypothetical protein